jgi:hypothetical protein
MDAMKEFNARFETPAEKALLEAILEERPVSLVRFPTKLPFCDSEDLKAQATAYFVSLSERVSKLPLTDGELEDSDSQNIEACASLYESELEGTNALGHAWGCQCMGCTSPAWVRRHGPQ